jgi:hypothetical protein
MYIKPNNIISLYLFEDITSVDGESLGETFESYFTTEMYPMYSSVYEVRRIAGMYITNISDDIINQLIHVNSLLAEDLSMHQPDEKWARFAGVWVAYKTAYILITNTEDFIKAGEGKVFKQLGDLSISREKASNTEAGLIKMMKYLECEMYKYEHAVRSGVSPLMDCMGLTDINARSYIPRLAEIVEKGVNDPNKPFPSRKWRSYQYGSMSADQQILENGVVYSVNTPLRLDTFYRRAR